MKYEILQNYKEKEFRRITGVKRTTFSKMVDILQRAYTAKHLRRGRTPKLCIEDMLLASLEYLREYRTYAHIAVSFGIAECNMYRTIRWVENTLIKDGTFSITGKKALLKNDMEIATILIDATETPIERPKKSKKLTTPAKRNAIP
jgi:hypothetical protein